MTRPPQISACDFRQPRRLTGSVSRALSGWLSTACGLLQEHWQALLSCVGEIRVERIDASSARDAVRGLADPGYAARLEIGPQECDGLLAFPEDILLAFVEDMLGHTVQQFPESRHLTPAETSMVELLLGEVARSLSQAWPEIEPLACHLSSVISRPVRSRVFQPDDTLIRAQFSVATIAGERTATLLLPEDGLREIGIVEHDESPEVPVRPPARLRDLARQLPVTLVVRLGTTRLTLKELNGLAAGDVLLLDQKISAPLTASVAGHVHWNGAPCRLGQRQGFRITSTIDY